MGPETILEVGSANGAGSTQAFISAAQGLKANPKMACLEIDRDRYDELLNNTGWCGWVYPIRSATVPVTQYMSDLEVAKFMGLAESLPFRFKITKFATQTVMDWRREELAKIVAEDIPQNGISKAVELLGGKVDIAFLDGSAFTGMADMRAVLDVSNVIILDDTLDIKNWEAYSRLCLNDNFTLVKKDNGYRNGFAAFQRRDMI